MERLTTNNPKNNLQTALNLFFVKDGQAWVRGGGPEPDYKDCSLYDYIRATMAGVLDPADVARMNIGQLTDEEIGAAMADWLMDGHCCIPGLIAHLYTAAWAFAELRARLMKYEDAEAEGRLVILDAPMVPVMEDVDLLSSDVFCPRCNENLSGAFGDNERILLQCPKCGQYIDGTKSMTLTDAIDWLAKEG